MPEINLNIPANSKFNSSLNEIDMAIGQILLYQMRLADHRTKNGKITDDIILQKEYLWDESRIFQVDELTTEEIFDTYLLRKNINKENNVDVSYPLLAYLQNDIKTVFWGSGNRYRQWLFDIPVDVDNWEIGDEVIIKSRGEYFAEHANIYKIHKNNNIPSFELTINNELIVDKLPNLKYTPKIFTTDDILPTGDKTPQVYKAKAITASYTAVILCNNRDEAQYIRDKFILRCTDAQIWFKYKSPTINNSENQIFTVFGIPNIERYPTSTDKLKGKGYIYGVAFNIDIWGCLTDKPLPQNYIETIRMNIHVEKDGITNKIVIN